MRLAIVGGGLVGLGTAYALQRLGAGAQVVVWEKEPRAGAHQSTHNSGVLHAGLYYAPGSRKAKLAVRGIRMMSAFARAHGVAHEICGKVVVATSADELPRLERLHERGTANGLRGLERLTSEMVREREPHVRAVAALLVPEEGIIDYAGVVAALVREITAEGGEIALATPLEHARFEGDGWMLRSPDREERFDFVVNCGGLHADRVARLLGERPATRIVPFRGEYFEIRPERAHLVHHLVYPVPDPALPFLGVHFTRMIHGGVECGPNAVLALDREGYRRRDVRTRDALESLRFPGLWRFVARHARATAHELRRSASPRVFLRSLQRLVPELALADLRPGQVGVRAQAMRPDGTLVEDFDFVEARRALHVLNAPSPAATASLAIGEEIARRVGALAGLVMRPEPLPVAG